MQDISRFQVWLVGLNPTKGKEINKTSPCVIISPSEMDALSTVIVAPMTTKGFQFPSRIECKFKGKEGLILLDQVRAVDKSRLIKKMGTLDKNTQLQVCETLQELFSY